MLLDFQDSNTPSKYDCDVAIVGAGAVGIPLAIDLWRKGVDVLLLEGGATGIETSSQNLNEVVSTGRQMSGLTNARFRMLGGSTNFWGGQIIRFDPSIFEPREWLGSEGWPFHRNELDEYYDKAAGFLGLKADFLDSEIWEKFALQNPYLGPDLELFLTRSIPNRSTAQIVKDELTKGSIRALVHANVVSLSSSDGGLNVDELTIKSLGGREGRVRAKRVVLANGTVEISRLLMSPLRTGLRATWADNSWLGKGFMDHIEAKAGVVSILDKRKFHQLFDNMYLERVKYFPRVRFSTESQRNFRALDVAGRFEFHSQYREHLSNLKLFARALMNGERPKNLAKLPSHLSALWKVAMPLVLRYLSSKRAFNPTDAGIDFVLMSEQLPIKESSITLTDQKNALGVPQVNVNWRIDGSELHTMATFAERSSVAFKELKLAEIHIDKKLAARDPSFLEEATDYYHQMGGARMGRAKSEGVVDTNLKVFGCNNLFVCGAAVYPFSGFGNPTYTAIALALRLSQHLSEPK